jgi:heptosyltransferase II
MEFEISSKAWRENKPPGKILVIRYQATGDLVITLPYLNDFKKEYPLTQMHLLCREEVSVIPQSLSLFEKIVAVGGGRNTKLQFFLTLLKLPFLIFQRYDVVIDLQNHCFSRIVRKVIGAKAWCAFDRISPNSAGDRTQNTINAIGLSPIGLNTRFQQRMDDTLLISKMKNAGWYGGKLVGINPAGAFSTRHWPIENYVTLAKKWLEDESDIQFVVTGLRNKIGEQVDYLKEQLGERIIDLTDVTNAAEAFALVRKMQLLITEDGGLMHMAWVQAVPTIALFGSSRSDWSAPQGDWSLCLNSSDLPCGDCLLEICKFGDVHCLTRYTPEFVLEQAQNLLSRIPKEQSPIK